MNQVRVYRPPEVSEPVFAQQSVFSVHPRPEGEFTHQSLERWLVEPAACWPIKRALSAAGFNLASLFPGMDGLRRHLGWLYKWSFFDTLDDPERLELNRPGFMRG